MLPLQPSPDPWEKGAVKSTIRLRRSEKKVIDFSETFKFLGKRIWKEVLNYVTNAPFIQLFIAYLLSACKVPSIVLGTEDTTTNRIDKLRVSMEFTYNVTTTRAATQAGRGLWQGQSSPFAADQFNAVE